MEDLIERDSLVVGLGFNGNRLNPNDRLSVEKALRYWLPDIEVIESTGHNWTTDEFSRVSWPMLRPNQLTSYVEELRRSENSVFFAGSIFAKGWASFTEGAIESGLATARKVHEYLAANTIH